MDEKIRSHSPWYRTAIQLGPWNAGSVVKVSGLISKLSLQGSKLPWLKWRTSYWGILQVKQMWNLLPSLCDSRPIELPSARALFLRISVAQKEEDS